MPVEIIAETDDVPPSSELEELVSSFYTAYDIPAERKVYLILLDDAGIIEYNQKFFSRDHATDVISVNIEEQVDGDDIWGEIYISTETARRESVQRGLKWEHEAYLYTIHGLLHLTGMEDETTEQRDAMWAEQLSFFKACGYAPALFGEEA